MTIAGSNKNALTIDEILKHPYIDIQHISNLRFSKPSIISYEMSFELSDQRIVTYRYEPDGIVDTLIEENPNSGEIAIILQHNDDKKHARYIATNKIPEAFLELIKRLKPNDKILFENIVIDTIAGRRRGENITITIVD